MLESRARGRGTCCGLDGAVAQLGERRVRNAKVEGSIPFRSTIFSSFAIPCLTAASSKRKWHPLPKAPVDALEKLEEIR